MEGSFPGRGRGDQGSMKKLLDGIQQSRLSIENDRKAYVKARAEIDTMKENINKAVGQCGTASTQIQKAEELYAFRATEFSHFEIKDKVVDESLTRVEEEVRKGWDDLTATRKNVMELTSRYLKESSDFSQMWNLTKLGRSNRKDMRVKELEELRRTKRRMEYDLEEFLAQLNLIKEAKTEMLSLENEFRGQEKEIESREKEAYKRLKDADDVLQELWINQDAMTRNWEDEDSRLQQNIQQVRESISNCERRVSENQRTVELQRSYVTKNRSPVSNTTGTGGNTNRFINQQPQHNSDMSHSGYKTGISCNKSARIYQPVKPTLKVAQPPYSNAPTDSKKSTPFQVPVRANNVQQSSYTFNENSGQSHENNASNPKSSYRSQNCVSLPSSTCFPTKPVSASSSGRVFQFKKKTSTGAENPTSTISGPTQRSVTVSLGKTPFSTFQNSRAVLQQPNANSFSSDKN